MPRLLSLLAIAVCCGGAPRTLAAAPFQDPPIPADTEVQTTASGLEYSVLQPGNGAEHPGFGDRVKVHYTGWTLDGQKFDSSRDRGEPTVFFLGQVIEGWNEGLALMSPGAKFKLKIPYALAYGEKGSPPKIPPKADLVFEIELLEITGRMLRYEPWQDGDDVTTTESGLSYRVLESGDGEPSTGADLVALEYAAYDTEGKPILASSMTPTGAPLLFAPAQLPVKFMPEAVASMQVGDRILFKVPPGLSTTDRGPIGGLSDSEPTLWQLKMVRAMKFTKPEFELPADEVLSSTPSGLKYRILRKGSGAKPNHRSQVTVHYAGWLTDGTQFDASYDRGSPTSFGVTQVIAGWTEGLQLMQEGGMIQLVIPSSIGYGERGSPPKIPGGATLVFVVELIAVR